jgi:hypothetical protein
MWIMTNNSYLTIVSKDCGPAELLGGAFCTGICGLDKSKFGSGERYLRSPDRICPSF